MPAESVDLALKLKPDAVYLLSDGEFRDNTLSNLRLVNRVIKEDNIPDVKTAIHTIAFQSVEGGPTLRQIAEENGGQFRFVK